MKSVNSKTLDMVSAPMEIDDTRWIAMAKEFVSSHCIES